MKKMDQIKRILVLMCCCMFLSGCVRSKAEWTIHADGTSDANILFAESGSLIDDDDLSGFVQKMEQAEKEGWTCERYEEEGYVGYTQSIQGKKLSDLAENFNAGDSDISIEKIGTIYTIDMKVLDDDQLDSLESYGSAIKSSGGYIKFVITLPQKAIESNATSVSSDGKTYTWDLLDMEDDTIHIKFSLINPVPIIIILCVLILLAIIVVIAIVVFVVMAKKRKNKVKSRENVETFSSVQNSNNSSANDSTEA